MKDAVIADPLSKRQRFAFYVNSNNFDGLASFLILSDIIMYLLFMID